MGATLNYAVQSPRYTLTDRATWLALGNLFDHKILMQGNPALFNQYDLIEMRTKKGIHNLKPGLTGWAQINGRDSLSNEMKVKYDSEYLTRRNLFFDLQIILLTFYKVFKQDEIL